jgi:outer membrane lipoprotein-sorting protein
VLLSARPTSRAGQIVPSEDPRIVLVRARDPARIRLADPGLPAQVASAPGGLQLYGWTAIDAQNKRTTVKLSNQRYNVAVPESAFTYAEPKKRKD